MSPAPDLIALFSNQYGCEAKAVAFAPGRVNLIGEHTDYNDGFVMPMAIQYGVHVAGVVADDGRVRAISRNFPDHPVDFALGETAQGQSWGGFLAAVLTEMAAAGVRPTGLRLVYDGDVPEEAGLSSSAAFAVATTLIVSSLCGREWNDAVALSRLCQAAEHRLGVKCGLLDQMASAACSAGSAMLLDCRDLSHRSVRIDRDRLAVIVGATGVKRTLAGSKYNERREECEEGAMVCGVKTLRDVDLNMLEANRYAMPENIYRRCRHVIHENARVHAMAEALEKGDMHAVGELALAGHASLRDDYEVSCLELDAMVASFAACEGVYGARMVGAGFGGSAIALADPRSVEDVIAATAAAYRERTGLAGAFYVATAGDGARVKLL